MSKIPDSLRQAISEEPARFAKYLDIKRIAAAKNPYREFKKQLRVKFGNSRSGLNMWKNIKGRYTIYNKLWKSDTVQTKLPDAFKGSYRLKQFHKLKTQYTGECKPDKCRKSGIYVTKKTIEIKKHYTRIVAGVEKKVKPYMRSKARKFNSNMEDFITRRLKQKPKEVMRKFNRVFRSNRSYSSIKTKLLRLRKMVAK